MVCSLPLICSLLFFFYELAIFPMYLLIAGPGVGYDYPRIRLDEADALYSSRLGGLRWLA